MCLGYVQPMLTYVNYVHIAILILIANLLTNYLIVSSPQVNYRIVFYVSVNWGL